MKNKEDPGRNNSIRIIFFLMTIIFYSFYDSDKIKIRIQVSEKNTKEPIPFVTIKITGDSAVTNATDLDGAVYLNLKAGRYIVDLSSIGYEQKKVNIQVSEKKKIFPIELIRNSLELKTIDVEYVRPLIEKGTPMQQKTMDFEEIKALPNREVNSDAIQSVGVYEKETGGELNIRGARDDASSYYVDGIKVSGSPSHPKGATEQITVITGGIPAQYETESVGLISFSTRTSEGVVTGGATSIPTRTSQVNSNFENKLTAGEINDFAKWKLWENESRSSLENVAENFGTRPAIRFCFQVTNENGWPVSDASVHLLENKKEISIARTDNTGKAECWIDDSTSIKEKDLSAVLFIDDRTINFPTSHSFKNGINHLKINHSCSYSNVIDIAFIVDATGSMSDEINYLKAEMLGLINKMKENNKDLEVRVASIFYRDFNDSYVIQYSDFNKPDKANNFISEQNADGGGDTPEAMDSALTVISKLNWSAAARARIGFLIADAPPHNTENVENNLHNAIGSMMDFGIRLVPIACSDAEKSTELLMRNLALFTNGTYLYLTDHSGVGSAHMNPTTDKLDHKKLNSLLLSVVNNFTQVPPCPENEIADNATETKNENREILKNDIDQEIIESIGDESKTVDDKANVKPNPTTGIVDVDSKSTIEEIQLFDLNGKVLKIFPCKNTSIQLDLSIFPVGNYILKVAGKKSDSFLRLIIQR